MAPRQVFSRGAITFCGSPPSSLVTSSFAPSLMAKPVMVSPSRGMRPTITVPIVLPTRSESPASIRIRWAILRRSLGSIPPALTRRVITRARVACREWRCERDVSEM